MRIFSGLEDLNIPKPILTIGTFDGVHVGHQKIIDQLNEEADAIGGESVLFTFFPHPRMVLFPDSHGLKLIQTQEEKMRKLEKMGLQNVIVFPFTFEFSRLTALEFVRDYLVNQLHVKKLVIGYDHQFGKNREGSLSYLKSIAPTYDFKVIEIPAQEIDEVNVSSTKIRQAIIEGDIPKANHYLGEPFELSGTVIKGNSLGRTIGFPTANLKIDSELKLIPGDGVYAVKVRIEDKIYGGMLNIGYRPTMGNDLEKTIEVNIFDLNEDLYERKITVYFLTKHRDEKKFNHIEELKVQLQNDEDTIRHILADLL
jgi:riboflavin kinase/FMN adenylyltransferase